MDGLSPDYRGKYSVKVRSEWKIMIFWAVPAGSGGGKTGVPGNSPGSFWGSAKGNPGSAGGICKPDGGLREPAGGTRGCTDGIPGSTGGTWDFTGGTAGSTGGRSRCAEVSPGAEKPAGCCLKSMAPRPVNSQLASRSGKASRSFSRNWAPGLFRPFRIWDTLDRCTPIRSARSADVNFLNTMNSFNRSFMLHGHFIPAGNKCITFSRDPQMTVILRSLTCKLF